MRPIPAVVAFACVLLAGCLLDPATDGAAPTPSPSPGVETWDVSSCSAEAAPAETAAPDLVVVRPPHGRDGATRLLRLERARDAYAVAATSDAWISDPASPATAYPVVVTAGGVVAQGMRAAEPGVGLLRFDDDLRVTAYAPVGEVGALGTDGDTVFVANASLTSFGEDFRVLGNVSLPLKADWKKVHDMLVHEGTAYLVDDVVMPLFVLRADVRDPSRLEVVERVELSGGHLPGHWVDAEDGHWVVRHTWGGRGGGYESAMVLPLEGGELLHTVRLHSTTREPGSESSTESGYRVLSHSHVSPVWAFVADASGASFGRLDLDAAAGRVDFCRVDLPIPLARAEANPPSGVHAAGRHVVAHWGSSVFVLDVVGDEPPRLLAAETLPYPVAAVRVLG